MAKYAADKAECEQYASEVNRGEKIARGAIGGAVVGGAIGAIVNRRSNCPLSAARVLARSPVALAASSGSSPAEVEQVIKQCLRGGEARVLN